MGAQTSLIRILERISNSAKYMKLGGGSATIVRLQLQTQKALRLFAIVSCQVPHRLCKGNRALSTASKRRNTPRNTSLIVCSLSTNSSLV